MAEMSEEQLASIISSEITDSMNHFDTEYSADRLRAMDMYLGQPIGNEIEGRSQVVLTEVADCVDQIMPSLMRIFTASDKYVRFSPKTAEDVERADMMTDYVNHIINSDNDGYKIFYQWFKDALLFRLGIVKFYYDETVLVQEEEYENLTEDEITLLLQNPDIEIVSREENFGEEFTSQNEVVEVVQSYNLKVKVRKKSGKVKIDNVPPEEFLINKKAKSLEDAYFIAHRTSMTVSDLVSLGYDRDMIEQYVGYEDLDREEEVSKRFGDLENNNQTEPADPSQKQVPVYDCVIKTDFDQDGISELRRVLAIGSSGDKILENELTTYLPFAVVTPIIMPHRLIGRSIYDLTEDLQVIKSTLMRQYLDSTYLSVMPKIVAVEGQVNLDDLMSSTAGSVIRTRSAGAVQPLNSSAGVGREIQPLLEYVDDIKENRTGMSKASMGLDANALQSSTASAVSATVQGAQQKIESYARTIAETGVKDLFRGILHLVTLHQQSARVVRLRNEFVSIDPREGDSEFDVHVNVGLGTADDQQKIAFLTNIASKQEQILQTLGAENDILDISKYTKTLREIAEIGGFKDTDSYFNSPREVRAKIEERKAQAQAQAQTQENPALTLELQKLQADIQAKQVKLEADIQLAREKMLADIELKKEELLADLELRKLELEGEERLRVVKSVTDGQISTNLPRN